MRVLVARLTQCVVELASICFSSQARSRPSVCSMPLSFSRRCSGTLYYNLSRMFAARAHAARSFRGFKRSNDERVRAPKQASGPRETPRRKLWLHNNQDSVRLFLSPSDTTWQMLQRSVCECVCVRSRAGESLFGCSGASGAARSAVRCALPNCVCGKPRTASVQFHSVRGSVCVMCTFSLSWDKRGLLLVFLPFE